MVRELTNRARLAGLAGVATIATVAVTVTCLSACEDTDVHDGDEPKPSWTVTNTSEDSGTQAIVYEDTGIEYIALVLDEGRSRTYGFCERYNSDGTIMHDGDATKGGPFGLEYVEEASDPEGSTKVYVDTQTSIAYMWHSWSTSQGNEEGLVPCRDAGGNVQKWDDHALISVTADVPDNGEDATDAVTDDDKADGETVAKAGGESQS